MSRMFRSMLSLTAVVSLAAPVTMAAQTTQSKQANLKVTADVVQNCLLTTTDVAFGTYDPVGTNASAPLDAAGTIVLTCTPGTVASIALDAGQNAQSAVRRMANAAARLNYELYSDAGRQSVWSAAIAQPAAPSTAPRTLQVYGRVAQGQNIPAGAYADTIVVTVTF